MEKKKILVTGAGGYMGSGIVKQLLDWNYEVIATDFKIDYIDKRAIAIKSDIFREEDPYNKFLQPDIMLHLAWRDGFKHNSLAHIEDLSNHFKFIIKMVESGTKHISAIGSMHEVGYFEGEIDDDTPTNPLSLYGIAKDALRKSITLYYNEQAEVGKYVTFQWLRGYYIVGNTTHGNSIFTKLKKAEDKGQSEFPFTSGNNKYDFLSYDEFCAQVVAAVTQDEIKGIINCCSGKPMSLGERVEQFIKENGFKIKLKYGAFPDRDYDSPAIWGNNEKIKKIISKLGQ